VMIDFAFKFWLDWNETCKTVYFHWIRKFILNLNQVAFRIKTLIYKLFYIKKLRNINICIIVCIL